MTIQNLSSYSGLNLNCLPISPRIDIYSHLHKSFAIRTWNSLFLYFYNWKHFMPDTLFLVVQRLARKVRIDCSFTTFSESDETLDLVGYINDAYQDLIDALPIDLPFLLNTSKSIILSSGTRLYNLDSSAHQWSLLQWSFSDISNGVSPLETISLEQLQSIHPGYITDTGKPNFVYYEGQDQVGFYPIPNLDGLVTYKFTQAFSRLSNPNDTFLVPDAWLRYIEDQAKYYYELAKGFTQTMPPNERLMGILAEAELMTPHYFSD